MIKHNYSIITGYNPFNRRYTSVAYFDNGNQITRDQGNTKTQAETRLKLRLHPTQFKEITITRL